MADKDGNRSNPYHLNPAAACPACCFGSRYQHSTFCSTQFALEKDDCRSARMEELVGATIRKVYVSPDQSALVFVTDGLSFLYDTEGDCCSQSWFSDIYNFDALLGVVASTRAILLPNYNTEDGRERQDSGCDACYGVRVTTDRGEATVVFRNSSNGYYGGWLLPVRAVESIPEGWKEITSDWSA